MSPREPNVQERELLTHILSHGSEIARSYLPQLEGIRVVRCCTCGCPSIKLIPADTATTGATASERIICDLSGLTASGMSVGLLVFQDKGRLSELEVYPYDDFPSKSPESNFPTIESLSEWQETKL